MPELTITVDPDVYRLSAVKKAAYRLGNRCYAHIELLDKNISLTLKPKSDNEPLSTLEGDFWNELLDQDLRESIAEQTERLRNLLMAQAFSGLSLHDTVTDTTDFRDDPLGITRSQITNE